MKAVMNRKKRLELLSLEVGHAVIFFDLNTTEDWGLYIAFLNDLVKRYEDPASKARIIELIREAGGVLDAAIREEMGSDSATTSTGHVTLH